MFNKNLCDTCKNKGICRIRNKYDAHYIFIKMKEMNDDFRIECKYYVEETPMSKEKDNGNGESNPT